MSGEIAVKRYAKALFEIGVENNSITELKREIETFKDLSEKGYFQFLANPVFSQEEKGKVMDKFFLREKSSGDFKNFVHLLIHERRINAISEIYDYYVGFLNDYQGQENAQVLTAVSLGDDQMESLKKVLSKIRRKRITVENVVDETVIGGMKVQIGSFIYDGSIRGFLDKFKAYA